jgi:hypothetical protein
MMHGQPGGGNGRANRALRITQNPQALGRSLDGIPVAERIRAARYCACSVPVAQLQQGSTKFSLRTMKPVTLRLSSSAEFHIHAWARVPHNILIYI